MIARLERVGNRAGRLRLAMAFALLPLAIAASASESTPSPTASERTTRVVGAIELAQAEGDAEEAQESRPLEPRYQPREPAKKSWYNGSYIFGMTRGVANSTMAPAGKAPLFVLTVPLDIVCLPFALIGGLFG
jgi:hypothetical protein